MADDDLPSLAAVPRTNHSMYDLAIPKVYETVTITEGNREGIGHGQVTGQSLANKFRIELICTDDAPVQLN